MTTRKEKVMEALSDGDWHEGYVLCHPSVGGTEGLRRLRELRADGHDIEKRRKKGSRAFEYRLNEEEDGNWVDRCTCMWSHSHSIAYIYSTDDNCSERPHPRKIKKETE